MSFPIMSITYLFKIVLRIVLVFSLGLASCKKESHTCIDGIQNFEETGVDCGGDKCFPCPEPNCDDGIQNGDEIDVDSGGVCDSYLQCPEYYKDEFLGESFCACNIEVVPWGTDPFFENYEFTVQDSITNNTVRITVYMPLDSLGLVQRNKFGNADLDATIGLIESGFFYQNSLSQDTSINYCNIIALNYLKSENDRQFWEMKIELQSQLYENNNSATSFDYNATLRAKIQTGI